ncbi:TlyA family RNA methyltransferase [Tepidiforma sp.]|uniref:TlyA family RNA methyltransferase n=1 Tax=Tepidiforma sp. TaxID=2682230 RepID=UPI0021DE7630|nr:TlyA family RNA methyltransferase [Tepidiforma sp.]MCX7618801.1 TlyA family RNA methyltransferase [Tepidiforma sp.]GIW16962.1 MAG: TlyA family rRNA (cytidine-2'-O)-methyltransferase [Tepidiforma sp.]
MARVRADLLLVQRGLAESREQARQLIMAGQVRSGTRTLVKPAEPLDPAAPLEVLEPLRYVSRGGLKLEAALRDFGIDPAGLVCLDLGASTGGFTDCLLQHGAARVIAVDVGRGQLHHRLRGDPRVELLEGVNARSLPPLPPVDLVVADLSFISLEKVLPAAAARVPPRTPVIALLKPQFEAGPAEVPAGGVIRDPAVLERVRARFLAWAAAHGWETCGIIPSPIRGGDGNTEYLVCLRTPPAGDA